MLPRPVASELLQAVSGRNAKVIEGFGGIHGDEFAEHRSAQFGWIPADRLPAEQAPCVPIAETLDHAGSLTRRVSNVKRYYITS
jgi:hypothetical protein